VKAIKKLIKKRLEKAGYLLKPHSPVQETYSRISYSQCGEDLIVQYIFSLRGIELPSYIDIGANHPYLFSNTALFYSKGCRGINIDANPQLCELFKQYRPQDINLNVGIADHEDELDFYMMQDDTLSTFSKAECDNLIAAGKESAAVKKIKLTTIETVLSQHYNNTCPDFLSLDVEGMDYDILKSIDFTKYAPRVICVEAAEYSPIGAGTRKNELINFLVSKNYYEYANTNLNAIMVRKDFWFI
jgi:FkbM family methyltransferase